MTNTTDPSPVRIARLSPAALALAFGVAGAAVALFFSALAGGMWGMMGGGGAWMHGSVGSGPGYGGSMMGSAFGFLTYALVWGILGGALAGGVSASVYNYVVARNR